MDTVTRPDGIVLCNAVPEDADQILALVADRMDDDGVPSAAAAFDDAAGSEGSGIAQYRGCRRWQARGRGGWLPLRPRRCARSAITDEPAAVPATPTARPEPTPA